MARLSSYYYCTDEEVDAYGLIEPGVPHDADITDPRILQKPTIFLAPGVKPCYDRLVDNDEDTDAAFRGLSGQPGTPHDEPASSGAEGAAAYAPPSLPARGWTPDRQSAFLAAIAEGHTVEAACRAVGLTVQSAYKFRRTAKGAAFAIGWNGAVLIQRNKLADALISRAFDG